MPRRRGRHSKERNSIENNNRRNNSGIDPYLRRKLKERMRREPERWEEEAYDLAVKKLIALGYTQMGAMQIYSYLRHNIKAFLDFLAAKEDKAKEIASSTWQELKQYARKRRADKI